MWTRIIAWPTLSCIFFFCPCKTFTKIVYYFISYFSPSFIFSLY
jgi:hypothetical protein